MALPNFLCVGAGKAGTTPLFLLLRQHPDVFVTPGKETHFFAETSVRDLVLYETQFFSSYGGQRAIGEFAPDYLPLPGNARRLREALGPIKIICCLREPLRRAFSHYHQMVRMIEEDRSFHDACEADERLAPSCADHLLIRRGYVRGSCYPAQLAEFVDAFGRENLFFMILERDLASPAAKRQMLERLCQFLDIDGPSIEQINLNVANTSLACPSIHVISADSPRRVLLPAQEAPLVPGDIVFATGNRAFDLIVRRPSAQLRAFFAKLAVNMTRDLPAEARERFRTRYFGGIVERTSEIVECELADFWSGERPDSPIAPAGSPQPG